MNELTQYDVVSITFKVRSLRMLIPKSLFSVVFARHQHSHIFIPDGNIHSYEYTEVVKILFVCSRLESGALGFLKAFITVYFVMIFLIFKFHKQGQW
jgi:hypothetical protein